MIVSSFSHMTRVDDVFCKQLVDRGESREGLFGFSEVTEGMSFVWFFRGNRRYVF